MIHTFLGETICFELIYKKRTTMGIYIDLFGNVEVQVPKETPEQIVFQLIEDKWDIIQQMTKEMKDRMAGPKEQIYDEGGSLLYLGNTYPILISLNTDNKKDHVVFEEDKLHIYVKHHEDERIKQALKRFYYRECKALVAKRIQFYQSHFKVKPRSISITDSKKTWGTCDSMRQLTFNWKLAMAPQKVVDYVVVHEMCHMVHMNHDRSFWRLVGKIIPDYEERQNWLTLSSWKMTV